YTSASLYLSMIEKNPKKFIEFWNDEHVGEAFAHPLIAPGTEAYRVAPPLMRDFMGCDHFPVATVTPIHSKLVAHGGIEVVANGDPDQSGPRLSKVAGRLLG